MTYEHEDAVGYYPYDPWEGIYDEAIDLLLASQRQGRPHLPTFARLMLKRLQEVGLLHAPDEEPVNVRKVKLDKEQELWIRLDAHRNQKGYRSVEVMDTPRSDMAILGAMIAWLAEPIDFKRVRAALPYASGFLRVLSDMEQEERTDATAKAMDGNESLTFGEMVSYVRGSSEAMADEREPLKHLDYLEPLIRYYKPGFDGLSSQEQLELLENACKYINDFLQSLRKLQAFLEYGAPNRKLAPAVKDPKRDVRAAILHEVDGLNFTEIGKRLGIPPPPNYEIKRDYQTVSDAVKRGMNILEKAFGKEGWRKRAETMRAEKAWWRSLSPEERKKEEEIEITALDLGIPFEEARRRVEHRRS